MPMTWNADTDAKLFAAVLATSDVKVNHAAVAQIMGPECTAKAVIHRINNIKIKATKADATTVEGTLPASAKTPTPKRGRKVKTEADEEESPTKKTKTAAARKTKTKAPVKMEPAEDEQPKVENVTDGNN
ncbi:uncharacterized protein PV06_02135 [Exophiala oligosperma]|uniref:Uncharacterized protein n=2 Tax=Chaetothyriales TaxID=34395 RepID=A0A0D2EEV6_9EURO|nr:uncharacterized protein PV06_02135 [Exophiala oligosperma]KAJ9638711.1 hypothetical protein H2204_004187 [Knufia peltigerae]KIW46464.1 hypothetical protein PV06_02135 [Exophiala oligosperma]